MTKSITVWLLTYNHERYIEQCINSVCGQTLKDEITLLWQDDGSSDGTVPRGLEIVERMGIECITRHLSKNSGSVDVNSLWPMYEKTKTKYVAMIEGDDFWCHRDKLKMQLQVLETSPNQDLVFARAGICDPFGTLLQEFLGNHGDSPTLIPLERVIVGDGGFMHTGSLFFRTSFLESAPSILWSNNPVGDYPIQVLGSSRGGALYLPTVTSIWRKGHKDSWNSRMANDPGLNMRFQTAFIDLIVRLYKSLDCRHRAEFEAVSIPHLTSLMNGTLKMGRALLLRRAIDSLLDAGLFKD
jgi:glycosyltransferase involved in cell wall biosynthesis